MSVNVQEEDRMVFVREGMKSSRLAVNCGERFVFRRPASASTGHGLDVSIRRVSARCRVRLLLGFATDDFRRHTLGDGKASRLTARQPKHVKQQHDSQ